MAIIVLLSAAAAMAVGWWWRREGDGVVVVHQKNWFKRVHAILSKYDQDHYLTRDYTYVHRILYL